MSEPKITHIEIIELAQNTVDGESRFDRFAIRVHTDTDVDGLYVTSYTPRYAIEQIKMVKKHLIGSNPLQRERLWNDIRFALRKTDCMGLGAFDIALWDFAGKYYEAPIHELLGSYRSRIPAYPATSHGSIESGLDSVESYVQFGEQCYEKGFNGYKIHTWKTGERNLYDIERDRELVAAVGENLGGKMDVMLDLSGKYTTFGDALKIGRVCDSYNYFWIEDPFGIQSQSQAGQQRLRELIETPVLHLEHVRGIELHADAIVNSATDFVRVSPEYDGGITGAIKIARCAEALGADVEFHTSGPARRHCLAAIRNANYYEISNVNPNDLNPELSLYDCDYTDGLSTIDEHGTVPVPMDPGLGVRYSADYIQNNKTHAYTFN